MTQDFYGIFSPHIPSKLTQPENQPSEKIPFPFFFFSPPSLKNLYTRNNQQSQLQSQLYTSTLRRRDTEVVAAALLGDIQSFNYPCCVWNSLYKEADDGFSHESAINRRRSFSFFREVRFISFCFFLGFCWREMRNDILGTNRGFRMVID